MTRKKKPQDKEFEAFVDAWYDADHDNKVVLAKSYGVSYETAKHWISESGATRKQGKEESKQMRLTVKDLLNYQSAINLDFVSFDIETSGLDADFSILLSTVIKPFGCPPIVFRADEYPEWKTERGNDCGIVKDVAEEMSRHAVLITQYGNKFDIPYIITKVVHHRLPALYNLWAIDTWAIAIKKFKLSRNSLMRMGEHFELGAKNPVRGELWIDAAYSASKEAMDEIVEHNIEDCLLLEKLACLCFPYLKSIPRL